jgi:hypothetical protein
MTSYGVLKKKIAGLLAQNEALIAERDGALAQAKSLDEDLTECEAERDALRTALRKYGRHLSVDKCRHYVIGNCECGLSALLLSAVNDAATDA